MPLPILKTPVESDLVRLFHRLMLHYVQHLGESESLDVGTAIVNAKLPDVIDANVLLDAAIPDGLSAADAVAMVDAHFAAPGGRCRKWVMNPSAAPAATQPLVGLLLASGAKRTSDDILYLARQSPRTATLPADVKIIPARASFKHARQLTEQATAHWNCPNLMEADLMHLDDPHWDSLLALKKGQPIAHVGVLAVGEAGLIEDVWVSPDHRRQGVGRLMMDRALEICARSLFKHVMLAVAPDNAPAQALYASQGFVKIGQWTTYVLEAAGQSAGQTR